MGETKQGPGQIGMHELNPGQDTRQSERLEQIRRDQEAFKAIFSKYGARIEHSVDSVVWNGCSLDCLNYRRLRDKDDEDEYYKGHPDDPAGEGYDFPDGPEEDATADLNSLYRDAFSWSGTEEEWQEIEASPKYVDLPPESKKSLMKNIVLELSRRILDYRNSLNKPELDRVSSMRTASYNSQDYTDDNLYWRRSDDWRGASAYQDAIDDEVNSRNPEDYNGDAVELGTYEFVIKQAINELSDIDSSPEVVDFLLDFWNRSKDPYFGPPIATAISRNNAEKGAGRILAEIKTAEPEDQNRLLSLLYRLELGRVGISEAGVNYLGRQFDVGLTSGFVSRLTPDGKVGVFDQLKRLVGLFQLESGDFTAEDQGAIKKTLESITLEMLFTPVADESSEARAEKEAMLAEFTVKYFETYIELFSAAEQTSGLRFNNLALPEQGFVLKFLLDHDEADPLRQRFFDFVNKYGEDGLKAFRSIEFDPTAGERILDLESRLKPEEIERLLDTYSQTYRLAEDTAEWINQVLNSGEAVDRKTALEVNLVREQILRYAQAILFEPEVPPVQASKFQREVIGAEMGVIELQMINRDLQQILTHEPTPQNFEATEYLWGEYLCDNQERKGDDLSLSDQVLSEGMQRLYNNPKFLLRKFEGWTTDTAKSLEHSLGAIDDMLPQSRTGDNPTKLVLEVGAGGGRITTPLALAGFKVGGIDNSTRMIKEAENRPEQFRRALLSGRDDHLVSSTQRAFRATGREISDELLEELSDHIRIREGNFFHYGPDQYRQDFGERQPDVAVIMWHTLGFAGSTEKMLTVVRNIFDMLRPGGRIIIEMPDRNFGGYARAIREFHETHEGKDFGVIEDAPSQSGDSPTEQNAQFTTTRYFPSNAEIFEVLKKVGFDPKQTRKESYFVQAGAESSGKLLIKENMFIADKPLDDERASLVEKSYPVFNADDSTQKRTQRHLRDYNGFSKRRAA